MSQLLQVFDEMNIRCSFACQYATKFNTIKSLFEKEDKQHDQIVRKENNATTAQVLQVHQQFFNGCIEHAQTNEQYETVAWLKSKGAVGQVNKVQNKTKAKTQIQDAKLPKAGRW